MKQNVGAVDKALRVILGLVLLALFAFGSGGARYVGLIGLVPLATALVGNCPAYSLLGISTCRTPKA